MYKLLNKHDGKQNLIFIICILYVIDTRSCFDVTMGGDEILFAPKNVTMILANIFLLITLRMPC
jgi:hypothetical protein